MRRRVLPRKTGPVFVRFRRADAGVFPVAPLLPTLLSSLHRDTRFVTAHVLSWPQTRKLQLVLHKLYMQSILLTFAAKPYNHKLELVRT